MRDVRYPSEDEIETFNALAITMFETKRSDQAETLSRKKLTDAIEACKSVSGGIYDKAAVLLRELVCAHAFASGNRRTAFITTMNFVLQNKETFNMPDNPSNARVLTGIREGYYSDEEIRDWIQHGTIREFTR